MKAFRLLLTAMYSIFAFLPLYTVAPCIDVTQFTGIVTRTKSITIETMYGTSEVTEPVLIELLECKAMQRLKDVYQLDVWRYAVKNDFFNRYDHSVGVFMLVRLYGGSLTEQIAALIHDVSHTAFSHAGALLFVDTNKAVDAFQDSSHIAYLKASGLAYILESYGFSLDAIDHKNNNFKRLEQELPALCADRIDYNIRGAIWAGLISDKEAEQIINALRFDGNNWYFIDQQAALLLARASVEMTKRIWGSPEKAALCIWLKRLLRQARSINLITADDIIFSTDELLWHCFKQSDDTIIKECLQKIEHPYNYFVIDDTNFSIRNADKFRGINPLVKTLDGDLMWLTEIDPIYKEFYDQVKQTVECGWPIRFVS